MDELPDRIVVAGGSFDLVSARRSGSAVYRGEGTYLRIGPGTGDELAVHRRLLDDGYPVAEILEAGEHEATPYFVERSLGARTWGETYAERLAGGAQVPDDEFWVFGEVMLRWAAAEVRGGHRPWSRAELAEFLRVTRAAGHLPDLAAEIRAGFEIAAAAVRELPGAMLHDDLHPFNACPGGVIDVEGAGWGVAGYDVVTAVLEPSLAEARWEHDVLALGWFSQAQVREYLARLDDAFVRGSAPPPSAHVDALVVLRAISACSRLHPAEAVRRRRRDTLARLLPGFLETGRVPLALSSPPELA